MQNKVAILHKTPLSENAISIDLRNKLDYKLSRFSSPAWDSPSDTSTVSDDSSSNPITDLTLKEFLAMLLNSRQRGRMTGSHCLEILPLGDAQDDGGAQDGVDQVFWNDRLVQGVLMRGLEPETMDKKSPSSRICVFGCMRNGIHQWLTGTKYVPHPPDLLFRLPSFYSFVLLPCFHYLGLVSLALPSRLRFVSLRADLFLDTR